MVYEGRLSNIQMTGCILSHLLKIERKDMSKSSDGVYNVLSITYNGPLVREELVTVVTRAAEFDQCYNKTCSCHLTCVWCQNIHVMTMMKYITMNMHQYKLDMKCGC